MINKNQITLTESQINLRIGLSSLIRDHVERGLLTEKELKEVVEDLHFIIDSTRFEKNTDDFDREFHNAVFNIKELKKSE